MKFECHKCPQCGEVAEATLEEINGWALLVFEEDGTADWEGETKIDWNSQKTYEDPMSGEVSLRCPSGHTWQTDMVTAEFTTIPKAGPEPVREAVVPQIVNAQVLKAMLDLLAIAEQGDPADDEEREALTKARDAARAAKAAACDPCPDCHTAEVLCEACGGHGFVPKAGELPRVLVCVYGGVVTRVDCNVPFEHEIIDIDDCEVEEDRVRGTPLPEAYRPLAERAQVLDYVTFR